MTDIKTWVRRIEREEPPDLWDEVLRRPPRSDAVPSSDGVTSPARGWRKAVVIATAAAVSVAAIGFMVLALRPSPTPPSRPTPGEASEVGVLTTKSFRVRAPVGAIAAAGGWVWASTLADRRHASLEQIDPRTGDVTLSIPLPNAPSYLVGGGGDLWAAVQVGDSPMLLQIDGTTGEAVRQFPGLGGPLVAAADGTVWAISDGPNAGPDIVQLDPRSRSIVTRVSTPVTPFDMAEAAGSVWALLLPEADASSDGGLARIDAVTARLSLWT